MGCRARLLALLGLALLLAAPAAGPRAAAAREPRVVTASARGFGTETGGRPEVEITIENRTGAPFVAPGQGAPVGWDGLAGSTCAGQIALERPDTGVVVSHLGLGMPGS